MARLVALGALLFSLFIASPGFADTFWGPSGSAGGSIIVQRVSSFSGARQTGATTFAVNTNTPQNTAGDQYYTLSITPSASANILQFQVTVNFSHNNANGRFACAIFQDSTANAIASAATFYAQNDALYILTFQFTMTAGTTSSTTFKLRCGSTVAGTTRINAEGATAIFNGTLNSGLQIIEYTQ